STDGRTTWGDASSRLPHTVVKDLKHDAPSDGSTQLIAATHGRGMFVATISPPICKRNGTTMTINVPSNDASYSVVRSGSAIQLNGNGVIDHTCGG
ncbi:MAG: hypothetical protein M3290_12315, partial [Actinomycetota bacterium]|nr:hypothetical protein [Actinomycetota bacterium]